METGMEKPLPPPRRVDPVSIDIISPVSRQSVT
jgi:hypothetical protein